MSAYARGRSFEYRVKRDMELHGWTCMRSPASRSPADIWCVRDGRAVFIQCKLGGVLRPAEWNRFMDYAEGAGAAPVMAERERIGVAYWLLTGRKDGRRKRQPMTGWDPEKGNTK